MDIMAGSKNFELRSDTVFYRKRIDKLKIGAWITLSDQYSHKIVVEYLGHSLIPSNPDHVKAGFISTPNCFKINIGRRYWITPKI